VGLDAALATLVERSAVPATLHADVPNPPDRPAPAIETIAYFTVAELLANVARHSGAAEARVEVTSAPGSGTLVVRVADDGRGGARPRPGSGLTGLRERVEAVDGRLDVSSPQGGPTTVAVELPLRA
jgi:signal transduction histidine kinase